MAPVVAGRSMNERCTECNSFLCDVEKLACTIPGLIKRCNLRAIVNMTKIQQLVCKSPEIDGDSEEG
jgi:hypothetical protein